MASVIAIAIFVLSGALKHVNAQVDPAFALSHACDAQCQQLANLGIQFETSQHARPIDPFYTVPENFTEKSKPGSLLYVEAVTNLTTYTVPSGLTMSRFIYTTTNLNGTAIPASAYVLWPYAPYVPKKTKRTAAATGIPNVGWTHGTTGSGSLCAPSNYQALQYNFIVPFPLALAGFAVIAPDYAGLGISQFRNGTRIPHAWLSSPSQANDLANAILAARSAFPALSPSFVAMGHSQGGAAAWSFAERQAQTPVSGYLGTISIAPPTNAVDQVAAALANTSDTSLLNTLGYQARLIAAVSADYPAYNFSGYTDVAFKKWQIVEKYGFCLPTESLLYAATPVGKPDWFKDKTVQTWKDRVSGGSNPVAGPVLLLAGQIDKAVPLRFIQNTFKTSTSLKENRKANIELSVYEGLDHFPVIYGSQARWTAWIKDRFDGAAVHGTCEGIVKGPRVKDTKQSILPNWLIMLPGATETWKTSL